MEGVIITISLLKKTGELILDTYMECGLHVASMCIVMCMCIVQLMEKEREGGRDSGREREREREGGRERENGCLSLMCLCIGRCQKPSTNTLQAALPWGLPY